MFTHASTFDCAREKYTLKPVSDSKGNSRCLFKLLSELSVSLVFPLNSSTSPDAFSNYFIIKINKIRAFISTPNNAPPPYHYQFFLTQQASNEANFLVCLSQKTYSLLGSFSCSFIPALLPTTLPHLVSLLNSFSSSIVSADFKFAAVRPLLKKHNFDLNDPANYRLISLTVFI